MCQKIKSLEKVPQVCPQKKKEKKSQKQISNLISPYYHEWSPQV
jgi:hypothetical protein